MKKYSVSLFAIPVVGFSFLTALLFVPGGVEARNPRTVISEPTAGESFYVGQALLVQWLPKTPISIVELASADKNYSFGVYAPKYGDTKPITAGEFTFIISSSTPAAPGRYYIRLTTAQGGEKITSKVFNVGV